MKRGLGSIKGRIVAIVVLFTLSTTLFMVFFSLYQFQANARRNLVQSTEFNLNLVAGIIDQDLEALTTLRGWCSVDNNITGYLADPTPGPYDVIKAFQSLLDNAGNNRAYEYLLRLIVTDGDGRILQVGKGNTSGVPVSTWTMPRLDPLARSVLNGWHGIVPEPFTDVLPTPVIYSRNEVYSTRTRQVVGESWLIISATIITDPLSSYQLPEGSRLLLTLDEQSFLLDGSFAPVADQPDMTPTEDETLNPRTQVKAYRDQSADFLSVSCPIGTTGLWLTQRLTQATITGNTDIFFVQILVICLGTVLMGLAILLLLSRMISRPILQLKERMSAIAGGDFSPDPTIEWRDELGDIGRGVNDLSRSVQELMDKRLADEKARRDLEYQMLQSQVNPHFLYNSLNSIKWMATIQNAPGIAEMTTALARLLKSVSKGEHTLIPLREELSLLDDYFVIQKYRYGGALALEKEIEPGTEAALLPRFSLQPLLENAIFHGIEPKGSAGTVRVTAKRTGDDMVLTLADDGVGMDQDTVERLLAREDGGSPGLFRKIGLNNVHRRIQYEFGPAYGLSVESEPGAYTRITIRLPFRGEKEEQP